MGSSAAAIVAGLMAADHLYELALGKQEIYRHAVELEGHPDNVAAALFGGIALCPRAEGDELPAPVRLEPPEGVEPVLVIPHEEVATAEARAALPAEVPLDDAVANVAAAAAARARDRALGPGADRPRARRPPPPAAPRRASIRARWSSSPRPATWARSAPRSPGAGPTVLVWCFWQDTGKVVERARGATPEGWADVLRAPFSPEGADVPEL